MPLLRDQLEHHIDDDRFEALQNRKGDAVVTYHELFPFFRPIHQADFEHKEDLINAVCHSSAFPFFASDWPVALSNSPDKPATTITLGKQKFNLQVPRLVVDGHFAVPSHRFGCPDFELAGVDVDRTILVTVFPREIAGIKASFPPEDCISPELVDDGISQSLDLLKLATQPSTASDLISVYDAGYADAERWCRNEENRWRRMVQEKIKDDRRLF
jgi:hypothetical protein